MQRDVALKDPDGDVVFEKALSEQESADTGAADDDGLHRLNFKSIDMLLMDYMYCN